MQGDIAVLIDCARKYYKLPKKRGGGVVKAVDGVTFDVREGEIFGLLGPNGAGKSTLIKIIAGLVRKDGGNVVVCGKSLDGRESEYKRNIGAIIEEPTLFKNMTARENLAYFAQLDGGVDKEMVDAMIKLVGLEERADDKFGKYSLGMKQRLGIAQAIMHRPKVLILDEPTNGLDPQWIMKTWDILRRLAREYGMAVIVSSHILSDMQKVCDRVGIINKGKLLAVTTMEEIQRLGEDEKTVVCYNTDNNGLAEECLRPLGCRTVIRNGRFYAELAEKQIPEATKALVNAGINIYGVDVKKRNLEDVFKKLLDMYAEKEVFDEEIKEGGDVGKML